MTDFDALIPEMKQWNNGAGIDVRGWIECVGDFEKAIGYSVMFWPQFTEIDGLIVREGATKEYVQSFLTSYKGDIQAAEAVINHVHIRDIHVNSPDPTREQLVYLGRVLREIHECKLRRDFPDRKFVVSFYEEPSEELRDYYMTFYQEKERIS